MLVQSRRSRALVGAAVVALLLGVAECVARAQETYPTPPVAADRAAPFGMFRADPDAGIALAKHVWLPSERFATNTFGHRDRPREAGEPAPWMTRVAVIGGTTGAGRGVTDEQTFARLIEDTLPAAIAQPEDGTTPPELEVWNLAVPGYGAEQALLRLEADWETVNPDVVLWAFELGDTPMRTLLGPGARRVVDGELMTGPWIPFESSPYEDERAGVLRGGLEIGPLRLGSALSRSLGRSVLGSLNQVPQGMAPFDPVATGGWAWLWASPPPEPITVAWATVEDVLDRLAATCADRGADLVVLAVPSRIDIDPEAFATAAAQSDDGDRDDASPMEAGLPGKRLRSLTDARSILYIDPTEALQASTAPAYYRDFPAWTAAGHRTAAAAVASALSAARLTPPFDSTAFAAELARRSTGLSETVFDGGFRSARGGRAPTVRWERVTTWTW